MVGIRELDVLSTEKDRLLNLLDKIAKRELCRYNDDNEVFAKTLMYILERLPDKDWENFSIDKPSGHKKGDLS